MPLGVLQTHGLEEPPGTVLLVDDGQTEQLGTSLQIKHGKGKVREILSYTYMPDKMSQNSAIVLVPQPSDDPNDPLNWSKWKKDTVFLVIFINTIVLASVPSPMLAPSIFELSKVLGVPLTDVAGLSGWQLLTVGLFGPIVSALAHKYGKRPQYIFANVMALIGTAICVSCGDNYQKLLAGRIIQGFGTTAYESLSLATIGDLYFVHERGIRTGFMVLTLTCMSSVVAIVGGPITGNFGWRYLFIIYLPFVCVCLPVVFFLVPETQFRRDRQGRAAAALNELTVKADFKDQNTTIHEESVPPRHEEINKTTTTTSTSDFHPKSFGQSLALWSGTYTDENLFKLLIAPLTVLLNPAVVWTLLTSGIVVALYVSLSFILAQIWSVPPYLLNTAQNGYFYVGALIGGIIGGVGGSYLCDTISDHLTRLNRGIYEPEFRIPTNIISTLLFGLGFFIFAWDVKSPTPHGYYLGAFCHGCICCAVTVASTAATLYVLDAYREQSTEIFVFMMLAKNLLFFGFSRFINSFTSQRGAGTVLNDFGIVAMCIMASCVPMYIFGKQNRALFHRKLGFMRHLGVTAM